MSRKNQYIDGKKLELDKLKTELEEFKRKAAGTSGALKVKLEQQIRELHKLREEAGDRLERVLEASEHAWDEMKDDADRTWKAIRHSVGQLKSHFKERDDATRK